MTQILIMIAPFLLTAFALWRLASFARRQQSIEVIILLILVLLGTSLNLIYAKPPMSQHLRAFWLLELAILWMVFEPEWAWLGSQIKRIWKGVGNQTIGNSVNHIVESASIMSELKTGALIAFERDISLGKYTVSGITLNADIGKELMLTLFNKETPTHDGGLLIRKGRMSHCGVIFPLTERTDLSTDLGTRHRAAIGLTEKTDALCLIVSEETGSISLAENGKLYEHIVPQALGKEITRRLNKKIQQHEYPFHYLRRFKIRADADGLQFSKSLGILLYDLTMFIFWTSIFFFYYPNGIPMNLATLNTQPWVVAPIALAITAFFSLLSKHRMTVSGTALQIYEERSILGLAYQRKTMPKQLMSGIELGHPFVGAKSWSIKILRERNKSQLIDRSSSYSFMHTWAQQLAATLQLPLQRNW